MLQNIKDVDKLADEVAEKVEEALGKPKPIQKIRNSQILSAVFGATGLALFLVGVEKVFGALSGWSSILIGITLMAASGVLLTKLK